jgi:hypothetical protein
MLGAQKGSSVTFPNGRGKRGAVRFTFLTGDCNYKEYGGKFISKKFHNGDWHYWLLLEVCPDEENGGYMTALSVVSPEAAEGELMAAWKSCGFEDERYMRGERDLVEILATYGVSTTLGIWTSKNFRDAWQWAHDEARGVKMMFGFYMDRIANGVGATGWDVVAGNVWGERKIESGKTPVIEELAKTDLAAEAMWKILKPLKEESKRIQEHL